MKYEEPKMELIPLEFADVVTMSLPPDPVCTPDIYASENSDGFDM